jgi:glycopeptide antibiotics resistance protein
MRDNVKAFCDYVDAVIHAVPWWVYGIALVIIIIGSIFAFIKRGRNKGLKISACLFLLFYVIVLFCSTVFFRATTTTRHYPFDFLWHYQAIGQGKVLFFPEIIMNIAVFVPIGFAIGLAFRKLKGWQAVLAGMGVSMGIELLQWFFMKGFADVDDVIHNTLGCVIGYLLYLGMRRMVLSGRKVV